jgi:hypothetical protein
LSKRDTHNGFPRRLATRPFERFPDARKATTPEEQWPKRPAS